MAGGLAAAHYADRAGQVESVVIACDRLAHDTYRVRCAAPELARQIVPGQFVMIRLAACADPLIGRALALWDVVPDRAGRPEAIELVFVAKGKFTTQLSARSVGTPVVLWGPLGNGFRTDPVEHLLMVAGGIGQTPFLALAKSALGRAHYGTAPHRGPFAKRVTLVYGTRSADYLAGVDQFEAIGCETRLCTDDGSYLPKKRVPELLREVLEELDGRELRIACCGPEPMMERVAEIAVERRIACEISLETPMACGIGICFSCVAKIRQDDGQWDYKRTCVEGPIFEAERIVW
jgi:dihydroorotate dehydrogenase electron transfer subunit